MGKWSKFKGTLEAPPQDLSYQEKVNVEKNGFLADLSLGTLGTLGEAFNQYRAEKDKLTEQMSTVNLKLEALTQLLLSKFEDAGVTSVRLEDGSLLTVKDDPYSQVADRAVFLNWVRSTGQEDLLSVHYQTMSAVVKQRLEDGEEPPPGVKVFLKSSLTRYKSRG